MDSIITVLISLLEMKIMPKTFEVKDETVIRMEKSNGLNVFLNSKCINLI